MAKFWTKKIPPQDVVTFCQLDKNSPITWRVVGGVSPDFVFTCFLHYMRGGRGSGEISFLHVFEFSWFQNLYVLTFKYNMFEPKMLRMCSEWSRTYIDKISISRSLWNRRTSCFQKSKFQFYMFFYITCRGGRGQARFRFYTFFTLHEGGGFSFLPIFYTLHEGGLTKFRPIWEL